MYSNIIHSPNPWCHNGLNQRSNLVYPVDILVIIRKEWNPFPSSSINLGIMCTKKPCLPPVSVVPALLGSALSLKTSGRFHPPLGLCVLCLRCLTSNLPLINSCSSINISRHIFLLNTIIRGCTCLKIPV